MPKTTPAEMKAAVDSASNAFKTWRETPVGVRARVMLKLQQLIRRDMVRAKFSLFASHGVGCFVLSTRLISRSLDL